ncbi:GYF domain-containing protein [Bdellovibrio svalbardensis]|uniref:GYF domain-containing protein n=1 Tax=Bdellovibrio svalbardensis TaxID=2972972 RepID=A0ABT6DFJ7_9BACT|nr:GYF domain-containing protein [Bdellovibrio svalbardensis]MDG0815625.1 GYF domain-containing protein [Bdellovibrio svalbardensis]
MNKQYYLSNNGTHVGPYTLETVLKKIEMHENQWTDYVFDESLGEWMMLLEHPEFSVNLSSKPATKPDVAPIPIPTSSVAPLKDKEWFILKEGNNYGPFSQVELVQMLQEKTLFEYDYVWHAKLPAWQRIAEIEDFAPETIRALKQSHEQGLAEIFFRRRHARASYGASLIVHNNKTVFRGQALEISAGGAGVLIDNPNLQPGQSLFLHFQPGDGVPPFNAVCQIVSKQFVKDGSDASVDPVRYGVKFTTLSQSVRESIKNYATAKAA